jgi:hypothetical protein
MFIVWATAGINKMQIVRHMTSPWRPEDPRRLEFSLVTL